MCPLSSSRLSAEAALCHPVFQSSPEPGVRDLLLLPSPHLQFAQLTTSPAPAAVLRDLRRQCAEYGEISECRVADSGHAVVHFDSEAWLIF